MKHTTPDTTPERLLFDAHQTEAITAPLGNQVITAGAGAGKTTVVAARIRHLIEAARIAPQNIIALTFTQAGGRALRDKIGHDIGWSGTLHAFVIRGFGIKPTDILSEEETSLEIQETIDALKLSRTFTKAHARELLQSGTDDHLGNDRLFLETFKKRCASRRKTTFDLVLRRFAFEPGAARAAAPAVLVIDEFQDTSPLDAACYRAMEAAMRIVVGDARQAIYGFRGASESFLLVAMRRASQVNGLKTTWRCSKRVTALANAITTSEMPKMIAARDEEGAAKAHELPDQARERATIYAMIRATRLRNPNCSIAVLARTNREVEELRRFLGAQFLLEPRTADRRRADSAAMDADASLLLHLRAAAGEITIDEFKRYVTEGQLAYLNARRSVQETNAALKDLRNWAKQALEILWAPQEIREHEILDDNPTVEQAIARLLDLEDDFAATRAEWRRRQREASGYSEEDAGELYVDTVHGVKGLEFDGVILAGADDRWDGADPDDQLENLLYVAITRARSDFHATSSQIVVDPWTGSSLNRHASERLSAAIEKAN